MSTILHVWKHPRPGTLSEVREVPAGTAAALPYEAMTHADYAAWVAAESAKLVPVAVTRRQLLLVLHNQGITRATIRTYLEGIADVHAREAALIEFDEAREFERTHVLVAQLAAAFGFTAEQVDDLFRVAATL